MYPTDNGAKRRILAVTEHMSQFHDVTFASLNEKDDYTVKENVLRDNKKWKEIVEVKKMTKRLKPAIISILSIRSYAQIKYWDNNFNKILESTIKNEYFDCIWVHCLSLTRYIEKEFKNINENKKNYKIAKTPIYVLDQHNVDENYFASFLKNDINRATKVFAYLEVIKARYFQKKWYPKYDMILSVSSEECEASKKYANKKDSIVLAPNGVDTKYFKTSPRKKDESRSSVLVFGASMDVTMNIDAALWFVKKIFPIILTKNHKTELWIVGRNPPEGILKLSSRSEIKITNTVPDVRDYYNKADVFVVPLRMGGGTKLKVLEAMAMGLPIVSTSVGAQGLDVKDGTHILIADSHERFAENVLNLLKYKDKAVEMGKEARKLVETRYSWNFILNEINTKLVKMLQMKRTIS